MLPIENIEETRLKIQDKLELEKTQNERNRLGQFATPASLAHDILVYAESIFPPGEKVRFLDPAFGTGSFYSALLQVFGNSRISEANGYEIDSHYGNEAMKLWSKTPLRLSIQDFTRSSPKRTDKANLVICNPPYVRHHHLDATQKLNLRAKVEKITGVKLNGLSGLYCYYVCLAHEWMAENGIAGWLVPSEFMDVNYGVQLKEYLVDKVTLLHVHRFNPEDAQFADADVSSAIVWFKNKVPEKEYSVQFTYGGTLNKPKISKEISTNLLREASKWTSVFVNDNEARKSQIRVSDLFVVKRGLATGGNDFFIIDEARAAKYDIPKQFLKPILPMPRALEDDEVNADSEGYPILGQKLFLLSCDLSEDDVRSRYPSLWRYLQEGVHRGISSRYLCKHRTPWYSQEDRPPAPFLCSYMGRRSNKRKTPFRFILNHSRATASNSYLLLYPKPYLEELLLDNQSLHRVLWTELQRIPANSLTSSGRVYGGGLHKLEPSELSSVPIGDTLTGLVKGNERLMQISN